MNVSVFRKIGNITLALILVLLVACGRGKGEGTSVYIWCARDVYDASFNVYTGTLLDFELYEEGFDLCAPTCKIRVLVKEVFKGDFKEGETVEDLCPLSFSDKNCDYMFMTGVNENYGYDQNTFIAAENVYSGKVLETKLCKKDEDGTPFYDVKVEVENVYKGEYKVGQIVEDTVVCRREEIRDGIIFMTSSEKPYLNLHRLEATMVVYNNYGNPFGSIKLLNDGEIELARDFSHYSENYHGFGHGIRPPANYDELIAQISEPLNSTYEPFIPQSIITEHKTGVSSLS